MLNLLKEWLLIYTWTELWIAVGAAVSMMGFWYLFGLMLSIQNALLRTIAVWSLIFSLTAGAATTNYIMRRRKDGSA